MRRKKAPLRTEIPEIPVVRDDPPAPPVVDTTDEDIAEEAVRRMVEAAYT